MSNSSIWPINKTLSGATTPGLSGPGSDVNEGVLCIPESSNFTGASPSDCVVYYHHPHHHHPHHHVVLLAQISLTLSRHFSLSFIASGRSSRLHPYPHIAAVCMFELVILLLLDHMWGSIGVNHLCGNNQPVMNDFNNEWIHFL